LAPPQISTSPSRKERIRFFLKQHGLRAWLAWRPDELVMMSGYLPFWGASVLLYPQQKEPVLFVPELEPRDHIPAGLRVRAYPWGVLDSPNPFAVLIGNIRAELKSIGVEFSRVGMLHGTARTSLPMQAAEQIPLPELFWEDLSAVAAKPPQEVEKAFLDLYLMKTTEEIQAIRLANEVGLIGLVTFCEHLKPGVTEAEIAAAVESTIYRQIGRNGIFHSRAWAMVQSGANSADAGRFNRSTGRRLENGDLVLIELATCVNGYWSDLTRTAVVDDAKPELQHVLTVVQQAQAAAIVAVRPGISAGEVDAVARDAIARHGLSDYFTHGTGHHVGFRYHDPGFGIVPGQPQKLEPGMVITIEPGVYVRERGGGARMEDNVLVTETGHEVLSATSRRLSA
jgi:Xaa-Pro aminopeptidase